MPMYPQGGRARNANSQAQPDINVHFKDIIDGEATVTTPRGFARTSLFSAAARAPAFGRREHPCWPGSISERGLILISKGHDVIVAHSIAVSA